MRLLLKQIETNIETEISSVATLLEVQTTLNTVNTEISIELIAADGSKIQTLQSENTRYWVNLEEVSRLGEKTYSYINGQVANLEDVAKAFYYFMENDTRLGTDFVWTLDQGGQLTDEELKLKLVQAQAETEEMINSLDPDSAAIVRKNSEHFLLLSDKEKQQYMQEWDERVAARNAQYVVDSIITDKLLKENEREIALEVAIINSNLEDSIKEYDESQASLKLALASASAYSACSNVYGHGLVNEKILCPHCNSTGCVYIKKISKKAGVSGGKATAALLTGGLSLFVAGLSRKEKITEAYCSNCNSQWYF